MSRTHSLPDFVVMRRTYRELVADMAHESVIASVNV